MNTKGNKRGGRVVGTLNKETRFKRRQLVSAVEAINDGRITPIELLIEAARLMRELALVPVRRLKEQGVKEEDIFSLLSDGVRNKLITNLHRAAAVANMSAEFAYPKFTRVDSTHVLMDGGTIEFSERSDVRERIERKLASLEQREKPIARIEDRTATPDDPSRLN